MRLVYLSLCAVEGSSHTHASIRGIDRDVESPTYINFQNGRSRKTLYGGAIDRPRARRLAGTARRVAG